MTKEVTNDFAALLAEIDGQGAALKAMPAIEATDDKTEKEGLDKDGKKIVAAAADGAEEGGDDAFGKSFQIVLADGTKTEAYDGTAMMKSLHAAFGDLSGTTLKGMTAIVGNVKTLVEMVGSQGAMIKSLQADIVKLGGQGSGRRAVLTVPDKHTEIDRAAAAVAKPVVDGEMLKSLTLEAQRGGFISGIDVSRVESALLKGLPAPEDVLRRIPDSMVATAQAARAARGAA